MWVKYHSVIIKIDILLHLHIILKMTLNQGTDVNFGDILRIFSDILARFYAVSISLHFPIIKTVI